MVKAILGYDIMPGMSVQDYEKWLKEVHLPDLSKVPGLKAGCAQYRQGAREGRNHVLPNCRAPLREHGGF